MPDLTVSELISTARIAKGLTRQQLAEAVDYSVVMIAKIESGDRLPDGKRIAGLAKALGIDTDELRQAASRADRRKSSASTIADAMRLARQNAERVDALKGRADQLTSAADRIARELDEKVGEFDRTVIGQFSALLSRIMNIPEEALLPAGVEPHRSAPEFSSALSAAQLETSTSIYALMRAGILGSGVSSAAGRGGTTATYLRVANLATAATGAAISGLSGAAAASATLAASGRLAAAGMGLTAGTGLLAGLVVAGAVGVVAGAVLAASGGRILDKQTAAQKEIEDAETMFDRNEQVVRRFMSRATSISEILTIALIAVRNHKRIVENAVPGDSQVAWLDLDRSARTSIQRMAEIVLACLTVIALPIGLDVVQGAQAAPATSGVADGDSLPRFRAMLDPGHELENGYLDYVIQEVFSQVAR